MDAELKQYLIGMEERIIASISEMEARVMFHVDERCEEVETKLSGRLAS